MYCDARNAGIHFYDGRPLAITTREVKQILTPAGKNLPVIGQIGFPWGDHEARKELIRRVREGAIGLQSRSMSARGAARWRRCL